MISTHRIRLRPLQLTTWLIAAGVLALAVLLGRQASAFWAALLAASLGGLVVLQRPVLGIAGLVVVALALPVEFGTGGDVLLNATVALVPVLLIIWGLSMVLRRRMRLASSAANRPLALFLAAGLLSLLIGPATWDPTVPMSNNFLLVQMAQWAIFAFSAGVFWLMADLVTDERTLWRLTAVFLIVAGVVAISRLLPGLGNLLGSFTTIAFIRAPLWVLLVGLAGGQLLYNRQLSQAWRLFLAAVVLASLVVAFLQQQDSTSTWLGIGAVLTVLTWLRLPRLRWPIVLLMTVLSVAGVIFPLLYQFAGGDEGWQGTGAPRLVLIQRAVEVTMHNPITGLGPAAYRRYAAMEPLMYQRAYWVVPQVNSHNNYVDIFAQFGVLGLALFGWFVVEVGRLGARLRRRYVADFAAGYVNGMLAVGVGALVIMALADWILPFVYNIGFPGFQASVLVWLFLGGLVALDNMKSSTGEP